MALSVLEQKTLETARQRLMAVGREWQYKQLINWRDFHTAVNPLTSDRVIQDPQVRQIAIKLWNIVANLGGRGRDNNTIFPEKHINAKRIDRLLPALQSRINNLLASSRKAIDMSAAKAAPNPALARTINDALKRWDSKHITVKLNLVSQWMRDAGDHPAGKALASIETHLVGTGSLGWGQKSQPMDVPGELAKVVKSLSEGADAPRPPATFIGRESR